MKKIVLITLVFGLCLSLISFGSNKNTSSYISETNDSDKIIGTWKLSSVDFGMEIPAEQKEMVDKIVDDMVKSSSMTFNKDKTFKGTSLVEGKEKHETGTYSLKGLVLTSIDENGVKNEIQLLELTSTSLVILVQESEQNIKLTFNKK